VWHERGQSHLIQESHWQIYTEESFDPLRELPAPDMHKIHDQWLWVKQAEESPNRSLEALIRSGSTKVAEITSVPCVIRNSIDIRDKSP
jgi:hypothetical protein